jgi:hypothetical protein
MSVNIKSTKQEIYDALKEAQEKLKQQKAATFNPIEEVNSKEKKKVVTSAESFKNTFNLTKTLEQLNTFSENVQNSINEYNNIIEAKSIKTTELNDLYGIESELADLASIIKAKTDMATKYDSEMENNKVLWEAKIHELMNEYSSLKTKLEDERKKEKEEFEYNLKRERKIENDLWEDKKAELKKDFQRTIEITQNEINDRIKELDNREDLLNDKQMKIGDFEEVVSKFNQEKELAVNKAIEDTKEHMDKSFSYQRNILNKDCENKVAILKIEADNLRQALNDEKERCRDISDRLNEAYLTIKSITSTTIESAAKQRTNPYDVTLPGKDNK